MDPNANADTSVTITNAAPEGGDPTTMVPEPTQEPAPSPNGRLFSEEEVAAIRKQEKDKLYSKMESMESKLSSFQEAADEQKRLAEELAAKEAEERRQREEAEMSAKELLLKKEDEWNQRINTAEQEWAEKFAQLQEKAQAQEALLERERRFQELESYKSRLIAENQDEIMPELLEFVRGESEQELEAAISTVKAQTSAIMESIQQSLPQQQRPKGIPTTGSTPNGPLENATEQQSFSADDIAKMSMEQYAQYRDSLIQATSPRR